MASYFMDDLITGKHHKASVDGLRVHYPGTCNVLKSSRITSRDDYFGSPSTAIPFRFEPSKKGLVAVRYETKGYMTFFVQLNERRAAWQRIEWERDFDKNWDAYKVKKAVLNFIWVAESEEARERLPKPPELE